MGDTVIALSSRASFNNYRESIKYAKSFGYRGIDWYLEFYRISSWKGSRDKFFNAIRDSKLLYSFHAPVNDAQIAIKDQIYSKVAFDYLKMYIDFLGEVSPANLTIHIGSRDIPLEDLSWDNAMDSLKRLVEHGHSKNVRICVENLAYGWTSNPELLMQIAESTDTYITFDIGHTTGGPWVRENNGTSLEFLDIIASRVLNAHVYEYENDRGEHEVPVDDSKISPVLDRLSDIGCNWWVLELSTYKDTEDTLTVIKKYLESRKIREAYESDYPGSGLCNKTLPYHKEFSQATFNRGKKRNSYSPHRTD